MATPSEETRPFKLILKIQYRIGEDVYLRTDPYQYKRVVTSIMMKNENNIYYGVTFSDEGELFFIDSELSDHPDLELREKFTDGDVD